MKKLLILMMGAMSIITMAQSSKNNENMNLLVKFTIKTDHIETFTKAAVESLKASRKEAGNLEMKLFVDQNKANTFFVYSRWKNQEAYDIHKDLSHTKNLSAVLKDALETVEFMNLEDKIISALHDIKKTEIEDDKLILFFTITVKDEHLDEVVKEFGRQVGLTRKEEGNLLFNHYQVAGTENTFVVYEHWKNQAALDNHFKQSYSEEMGKLLTEAVEGPLPSHMSFVKEINN